MSWLENNLASYLQQSFFTSFKSEVRASLTYWNNVVLINFVRLVTPVIKIRMYTQTYRKHCIYILLLGKFNTMTWVYQKTIHATGGLVGWYAVGWNKAHLPEAEFFRVMLSGYQREFWYFTSALLFSTYHFYYENFQTCTKVSRIVWWTPIYSPHRSYS